jgi:predicted kinase
VKKLILVTSPPASGKTYVSKKLAEALSHVVYLDKDTLIPLSKQIFVVAGEEYNRSSDFFNKNIRDFEYETIVALALEALNYDDIVLINAPFTKEIRDLNYINMLKAKLRYNNTSLVVIWVQTSKEVTRQRMIARKSDRDTWKLAHWDEYIAGLNFDIPIALDDLRIKDDLLIFKNSSNEEFTDSLKQIVSILEEPSNRI